MDAPRAGRVQGWQVAWLKGVEGIEAVRLPQIRGEGGPAAMAQLVSPTYVLVEVDYRDSTGQLAEYRLRLAFDGQGRAQLLDVGAAAHQGGGGN